MSYSSEKSPEAQVAVLGSTDFTTGYPDHQEQQPPPYDPSISQPTSDDKLPVYNRSLSPTSRLNTPSTTSLASLEDVTRPKTSTCTKFFISQQGNTLKPWPFSNSNELVTPIYDSTRTFPLYTSTRFKKCSGTCVLTPVYSADHQQPADPKDQLEVHTTYYFGPGNDPVISCEFGEKDSKVEIEVKSKGKWTRSRWFKWNGERYEWRYVGKSNAAGMVLQRVLPEVPSTPEIVINDEKRPTTPTSPKCKGKGKAKKGEENYVTVAEFRRAEEENKRCVGFSPAGQGGWVSIYEKEGEGRGGLPEWLVFTSCLVMLKRERDRRNIQIAMMIGGAVGGGS